MFHTKFPRGSDELFSKLNKRTKGLLIGLLVVSALAFAQQPRFSDLQHTEEHNEWIADTLVSIPTIQIGVTRDNLEKLFTIEGGFHSGSKYVYQYKQCGFIKVDVEFNHLSRLGSEDTIVHISRPYLEKPSHAAD